PRACARSAAQAIQDLSRSWNQVGRRIRLQRDAVPARYGLWASVARRTLNGTYGETPFGLKESIDIKAALRSYTIWAAHQMCLDDRVGSIEPGKDADIAVWDRDLYTMPTGELKNLRCELTLLRG